MDSLAWLYGRQSLGIKLGLDKVHRMMNELGNPQDSFQSIHVAGTNGKGSVCAYTASALQHAGFKVGKFTSPHLIRFGERITVNGNEIPPHDVARLVKQLRPIADALDTQDQHPTFFELVTAMAFLWFKEQGVQWAIIETGMGGRLDATNVLQPALTIITNVGLDHQVFLGDHIVDIAFEKAGIMKPGVPCVTAAVAEPLVAIKATSQQLGCPMSIIGEDYQWVPDVGGMMLMHPGGTAHYNVSAAGAHQLQNAAITVSACDALRAAGLDVPIGAVQHALSETIIPGRLETLEHQSTKVLLDGAHNLDGAVALRQHLAHLDVAGFQLIVGFSTDKEWESMLGQWAPIAARVIGVPLRSSRGLAPKAMAALVEGIGIPFESADSAADALNRALASGPELVVVAGSLFLVGEARAAILGESMEDIHGSQ